MYPYTCTFMCCKKNVLAKQVNVTNRHIHSSRGDPSPKFDLDQAGRFFQCLYIKLGNFRSTAFGGIYVNNSGKYNNDYKYTCKYKYT